MSNPRAAADGRPRRFASAREQANADEMEERLRTLASPDPAANGRMRVDERWPTVGQQVTLESPPTAGHAGGTVSCEVVAVSPPDAALLVLGEHKIALPSWTPVIVALRNEQGISPLEGLVVDTWSSGHINVRFSPTEQRRHRRRRLSLSVELRRPGQSSPSVLSCSTIDVAAGGLRVRANERLDGGEQLFAALSLPEQRPVLAIVRVVREPKEIGEGRFEVGLQFSTVSDVHRARLVVFLSQQHDQLTPGR